MGIENKTDQGDYVGYRILTKEGVGIQIIGPMERSKAIKLATELANSYSSTAIRAFAKNKGEAILLIIEAFNRRERLKNNENSF